MSHRHDTSLIAGAYVFGNGGLGVLARLIPASGASGPGYAYKSLSLPDDNNKEICGAITTYPDVGTLVTNEDTTFIYSGGTDGPHWFEWQLKADGQEIGAPVRTWLQVGPDYANIAVTLGDAIFSGKSVIQPVAQFQVVLDDTSFSGSSVTNQPTRISAITDSVVFSGVAFVSPLSTISATADDAIFSGLSKRTSESQFLTTTDDAVFSGGSGTYGISRIDAVTDEPVMVGIAASCGVSRIIATLANATFRGTTMGGSSIPEQNVSSIIFDVEMNMVVILPTKIGEMQ